MERRDESSYPYNEYLTRSFKFKTIFKRNIRKAARKPMEFVFYNEN